MGNSIKGLTVEINGNVTPLNKALGEVNAKSKDLQSELKSVEKLLKFDPSNTELLAQKQTILAQSVQAAKEKLDTLKTAAEQAKDKLANGEIGEEQFRALQREVVAAEQKLSSLTAEEADFKSGADKAGNATKDLGNDFDSAGKKALDFGDVLKANLISDAVVGGIRAIGSAVAAAARELVDLAKGAMDTSDKLVALSAETGQTTEQLQVMQYIGDDLGVSLDTQTGALSKLVKNMSGAKDGTGAAADAFKQLEISVTDSNGELRDSNDVYKEALGKLGGVGNETERDAMAMALFGKSARELNPLIEAGTDGLASLEAQAYAMGAVMSEETVAALDSLGDSLDHIKQSIQTAAGTFVAQFAPALSDVSAGLTGLLSGTVSADEFMGKINTLITQVAGAITSALPTIIQTGGTILTSLLKGIITALPQIVPAAVDVIMELNKTIIESLPLLIEAALQIIISLATGIAESLPELIPTIVDVVIKIVETLIDNVDQLVDAAIAIIIALAEGIIAALPKLIEKAPEIIIKLVAAIIENTPKLLEATVAIIAKLAEGLAGLGEKALQWGGDMLEGFVNGIKRKISLLVDSVKNVASTIASYLHFSVPDTGPLAEYESWMPDFMSGLADGINKNKQKVEDAISALAQQMNIDTSANFTAKVSYATANASDFGYSPSAPSLNDTVGAALLAGLAAIGDAIYDAIPKNHQTILNGKVIVEETWDDFETAAANKNRIYAATREAIASIARSV